MVSFKELQSRVKTDFEFTRQELFGIAAAIVVIAFIFSFRDWGGETFDPVPGLQNFMVVLLVAALTLFFRVFCQKVYGLSEGHKVQLKLWWLGLALSVVVTFISLGRVPIILLGSASVAFMVRQRLGEFRYGFSYWVNGLIAYWGVMANLILALVFAIGLYFSPDSYFFNQGLLLNLIMAFCALFPLPQLDGLRVFFGSRYLYALGLLLVLLAAVLLLTQTALGLIIAVVIGAGYAIIALLISSEK